MDDLERARATLAYIQRDCEALGFILPRREVGRGHRIVMRAGEVVKVTMPDGRRTEATLLQDQGFNQIGGDTFIATSSMPVQIDRLVFPAGTSVSMSRARVAG